MYINLCVYHTMRGNVLKNLCTSIVRSLLGEYSELDMCLFKDIFHPEVNWCIQVLCVVCIYMFKTLTLDSYPLLSTDLDLKGDPDHNSRNRNNLIPPLIPPSGKYKIELLIFVSSWL